LEKDTATAIDSHSAFASKNTDIKGLQITSLYQYLQNALLEDHNAADVARSIDNKIVTPAITLARKVGIVCFARRF
jgi:hypothetical protein